MKLLVENPGLLTTVQDLGRWGYQSSGVPVAGAMDTLALKLGNILLGNAPGDAGLEMTLLGATFLVEEGGCFIVTGADMGLCLDGLSLPAWKVCHASAGSRITFSGARPGACRAYFCIAGGVDVPLVMGSRSTYTRGGLGGYEGRPLKRGDRVCGGEPDILASRSIGLEFPVEKRPDISNRLLGVLPGPQDEAFTEAGLRTFFESEYTITQDSDRMGCRFDGPVIEHAAGADIISDAVSLGAIQVPGQGRPIAMLADRQTTGGYTKIGVLSSNGIAILVQRSVGDKVRFVRITREQAVEEIRCANQLCGYAENLRAQWRSRQSDFLKEVAFARKRHFRLSFEGRVFDVDVQLLEEKA